MVLNLMANNIARFFYAHSIIADEDSIEVYAYGLELMISAVINVLVVLIASIVLHVFFATFAFLTAFISLRTYAGGYHASTHFRCLVILIVVYALYLITAQFLPVRVQYILTIATPISTLAIVYFLAPLEDANKPLNSAEWQRCRNISLKIAILQMFFVFIFLGIHMSGIITFGFTYGQLAATFSLIAAKIYQNGRGERIEEDCIIGS